MLKDYPIRFDGEKIFTPTSWEEDSAVVESVNETEAGTDQIIVTRYDKLTVAASFQCSSTWAGKFKAYSKQDSVVVRMYDLESHRDNIAADQAGLCAGPALRLLRPGSDGLLQQQYQRSRHGSL